MPETGAACESLFPGNAARPTCQKEHIGPGQRAFTVAPGDFFDHNRGAAAAIDTPHSIQQEDEKSPQGDELKAAFGKLVVTGAA